MMNRYDPLGPAFLRMGRRDPGEAACALWWSGSGIRTRVDCTRFEVEATAGDDEFIPWLAVTLDGAPVARFPLRPGTHRYSVLGVLEKGTAHELAILRDTQPTDGDSGPLVLNAVYTDGEPKAPAPRSRLVEFIGDSLTVGEGTVGDEGGQEWRMVYISNQFAFPTLAAEALKAEKRVIALGGWGAYLAFDGDPNRAIGKIYDRLCPLVPGGDIPYDFAAQRPADAVVINLGTNDGSAMNLLEGEAREAALSAFEDSAVALLAQVRAHNPDSHIIWAYGLCGTGMAAHARRAVERRRAEGDERVSYLALDDCDGSVGSRSHPSRASHIRAARQIAEAIGALH